MQLKVILVGNRIATRVFQSRDNKRVNKDENGKRTLKIEKDKDREKEKVGDRTAKFNKKESDRELEREITNKGDIFCWKKNMKIL